MTTAEPTSGRRIGEMASATGLTVRTLHYYDEIGLLVASDRTAAGYRLYSAADVERLYRICLLRRLGLPLADIARALDDTTADLRTALTDHLRSLEERLEVETRLRGRLSRLVAAPPADPPLTTDLLEVLEEMTMLDTTVQKRISILVYADLEAAHDFLVRVFGFEAGELTRDDHGRVIHAELYVGDGVVWLHQESPEFGLASPASLGGATATMAVMVDDVDAHFRHASSERATIRYEPTDQAYGYREYGALDLEGCLWSFMKPLD
ncbi:MAG: MerR family transcriptional regulator [Acidimicrobiia bacterium]|nr:MerR family transcriptional regulator [Acidimicrobiia bacterium]